jgi:hypothetical protein
LDDCGAIGIADDQHERGDHQWLQPGGRKPEHISMADNAALTIAINGAGKGTIDGLTIAQPGSQVSGLDIENFGGDGITITAAGQVQLTGCFIGTDPTGEVVAPNGTGVGIENSSNAIGGPLVADRNIISISLGTRSWWQRRQVEDIVQASGNRSVRPGLALPNKGMPP